MTGFPDSTPERGPADAPAGPKARVRPDVLAAVAAGGALGAPARYGVARLVHVPDGSFPWATFWTNVSGSFALGFLLVLVIARFPPSRYLRPFFATGFLGAFTTFSTFAVDTDLLLKDGRPSVALAYAVTTVAAGLTAAWAGMVLARMVPAGTARPRDG
ncbi:MAG: fluoride efflux transporter CrcB [Acidimicrobiales bacterium]